MLMSAALVGLCACSLISKKSPLGSDTTTPTSTSVAGAPAVSADEKDSPVVKNKLRELAEIETLLGKKQWTDYALKSSRLRSYFLFENGLAKESKREAIIKRLDALDAAAYETFPRLHALVGSGVRVVGDDAVGNALEPLVGVLDACDAAHDVRNRGALDEKVTAYERALARVKKVDPNAFRYFGDTKSRYSTKDIPNTLLKCEGDLAAAASGFAEEYVEETVPATEVAVGCGSAEFLADGIRTGSNAFAAYTRTEGGASYPEKLDCKKLAKKNNFAGAFADAVKDYARYIEIPQSDLVVVSDGKPFVEVSESDGYLHRYQRLVAYSKKFRFAKNPCGGEKIFCEAGGSKGAQAFNRLEHALDRAQVHAGSNPQLCKTHLKDAKSRADWFAEFHADAKKSKSWISGATYKTKKGQKLDEGAFIAAFKDKGQLADDRLLGTYCDSPAKQK
jgi:hypothetical protein